MRDATYIWSDSKWQESVTFLANFEMLVMISFQVIDQCFIVVLVYDLLPRLFVQQREAILHCNTDSSTLYKYNLYMNYINTVSFILQNLKYFTAMISVL